MTYGNEQTANRMTSLRKNEAAKSAANYLGFQHGITRKYTPNEVAPSFRNDYNIGFNTGKSMFSDQLTAARA
jgi:hypothetical protein